MRLKDRVAILEKALEHIAHYKSPRGRYGAWEYRGFAYNALKESRTGKKGHNWYLLDRNGEEKRNKHWDDMRKGIYEPI